MGKRKHSKIVSQSPEDNTQISWNRFQVVPVLTWDLVPLLLASQVKNLGILCLQRRRCRLDPWVGKILWRREWEPTPIFLPEESHGQESLAGYSPRGCKESDLTEVMNTHAPLHWLVIWHQLPLGRRQDLDHRSFEGPRTTARQEQAEGAHCHHLRKMWGFKSLLWKEMGGAIGLPLH